MKDLFPMRNFGATLFSTIGGDSTRVQQRRRAMTEVEELQDSEMIA
jgi:hypothetical protein